MTYKIEYKIPTLLRRYGFCYSSMDIIVYDSNSVALPPIPETLAAPLPDSLLLSHNFTYFIIKARLFMDFHFAEQIHVFVAVPLLKKAATPIPFLIHNYSSPLLKRVRACLSSWKMKEMRAAEARVQF